LEVDKLGGRASNFLSCHPQALNGWRYFITLVSASRFRLRQCDFPNQICRWWPSQPFFFSVPTSCSYILSFFLVPLLSKVRLHLNLQFQPPRSILLDLSTRVLPCITWTLSTCSDSMDAHSYASTYRFSAFLSVSLGWTVAKNWDLNEIIGVDSR